MRRLALSRLLLLPAAAAILGSGCIFHIDDWGGSTSSLWGQDVESRGDVLYVDDVALHFHRWVDVTLDLPGMTSLEIGTASEEIVLGGMPGDTARLSALVYSEVEGDGTPVIENGRLVARSEGGHKVFINAVKGTVPAAIALTVASGTGSILVEKLAGTGELHGSNGTGDVTLRGCDAGSIKLENGTGDTILEDCNAPQIGAQSGTGDVVLRRCKSDNVRVDTGTGDTELAQCEVGTLGAESGTGDVIVDGGRVQSVQSSTGTGDFLKRNGAQVGDLSVH